MDLEQLRKDIREAQFTFDNLNIVNGNLTSGQLGKKNNAKFKLDYLVNLVEIEFCDRAKLINRFTTYSNERKNHNEILIKRSDQQKNESKEANKLIHALRVINQKLEKENKLIKHENFYKKIVASEENRDLYKIALDNAIKENVRLRKKLDANKTLV